MISGSTILKRAQRHGKNVKAIPTNETNHIVLTKVNIPRTLYTIDLWFMNASISPWIPSISSEDIYDLPVNCLRRSRFSVYCNVSPFYSATRNPLTYVPIKYASIRFKGRIGSIFITFF